MAGEIFGTTIGINGCGRMGKGLLRYLIAKKLFPKIIINFGRKVGESIDDVVKHIMDDTIYGSLNNFAFGVASDEEMEISINYEEKDTIEINGVIIHVLQQDRNPKNINWAPAVVVVDTTGKYNYPNKDIYVPNGSVKGHLVSGSVKKVLVSSPFKDWESETSDDDTIMLVQGINDNEYNPSRHSIVSAASCTTTALAHTMKPLLQIIQPEDFLAIVLTTVHAWTGKQTLTDRVPASDTSDLVRSRSAIGNIFLSSTGAAKALPRVIPEVIKVQYSAKSVRVPTLTSSLIMATIDFKDGEMFRQGMTSRNIDELFKQAAYSDTKKYLRYFEHQSVATDVIGEKAAASIMGGEAELMRVSISNGIHYNKLSLCSWYDNEFGYVYMLTELLKKIVAGL